MDISVLVCSGLTGGEVPAGKMRLRPQEVGTASDLFSSTYILRMDLHYERYLVSGYLPSFHAIRDLYTTFSPAASLTKKVRAPSVTGNIGESIASLIARRKLGSRRIGDIEPIIASSKAKAPDYLMHFRPMFPPSFQLATGVNPAIAFARWPVESKAVATSGKFGSSVRKALQQLGTYWYKRAANEPDVVGFGIVVCLIYRDDAAGGRLARVHVFTPANQTTLLTEIAKYSANGDRAGFLEQLRTEKSIIRGSMNDLD
jgi:hypothetical protein